MNKTRLKTKCQLSMQKARCFSLLFEAVVVLITKGSERNNMRKNNQHMPVSFLFPGQNRSSLPLLIRTINLKKPKLKTTCKLSMQYPSSARTLKKGSELWKSLRVGQWNPTSGQIFPGFWVVSYDFLCLWCFLLCFLGFPISYLGTRPPVMNTVSPGHVTLPILETGPHKTRTHTHTHTQSRHAVKTHNQDTRARPRNSLTIHSLGPLILD